MPTQVRNIFLFISLQILVFCSVRGIAQTPVQPTPLTKAEQSGVVWIGEWPSEEIKNQKKDVKKHIKDFIFGKGIEKLKRPVSLVTTGQDNYWILDQENNAVINVDGKEFYVPHFIEKKNSNFGSLVSICKFKGKEMLFTDSHSNKIFVFNPDKKECVVLNDTLKLIKPTGIAYSAATNEIWLTETGKHQLIVLNEKGEIKKRIGMRGNQNGEFNFPTHLCIDKNGNVYVVDAMNFRIQIFNKDGIFQSTFGTNGDATGSFASPKGIATDSYGNIYVVDALFHAVQIFDIKGNFLYAFGRQGQGQGEFWIPSGIYIDENNKIFVADSYNSRIQIFQLKKGG